eukprot:1441141-Amphidinium_carterae.1
MSGLSFPWTTGLVGASVSGAVPLPVLPLVRPVRYVPLVSLEAEDEAELPPAAPLVRGTPKRVPRRRR